MASYLEALAIKREEIRAGYIELAERRDLLAKKRALLNAMREANLAGDMTAFAALEQQYLALNGGKWGC